MRISSEMMQAARETVYSRQLARRAPSKMITAVTAAMFDDVINHLFPVHTTQLTSYYTHRMIDINDNVMMYEYRRNYGEIEVGWESGVLVCWSTKAAISLKRVKIEEKLPRGPLGSHQRSFQWYHLRPPTTSSY